MSKPIGSNETFLSAHQATQTSYLSSLENIPSVPDQFLFNSEAPLDFSAVEAGAAWLRAHQDSSKTAQVFKEAIHG